MMNSTYGYILPKVVCNHKCLMTIREVDMGHFRRSYVHGFYCLARE